MIFPSVVLARRWLSLGLAALWLAATAIGHAQTLAWNSPFGTVTLYGSGALTTFLETSSTLDSVQATDLLNYLDSSGLPAVSQSEAATANGSFGSFAQLSVVESQASGLPFVTGSFDFSSSGSGVRSSSGAITLYLLINVPNPAEIRLDEIRSSIAVSGFSTGSFALDLFQSDNLGGKFGEALLSYGGNNFDVSGAYQTSAPYYLLEMSAMANATASSANAVSFSYFLDLGPVAAVPEPSSGAFLLVAIVAGLTVMKVKRSRNRRRRCLPL